MNAKKKINKNDEDRFSISPSSIDLNFEKKDELVEDIFNKKTNQSSISAERKPIKISKLEKVALPGLVVAAVFVACSLVFNLFFYKSNIDLKKEMAISAGYFLQTVTESLSYFKEDLKTLAVAPSFNLSAGIGFLGGKIAELAFWGSKQTIILLKNI